ncbi:MAG: hypothetical protein HOA05_04910 [Candidatus Marinimicrobia bacterium]|jgi:hypothetical protein|nr:hypothetical protein [Candidatus Neomarinimicrobiota bacterium]
MENIAERTNILQVSQQSLLNVNQFTERHPAFTFGALRWMIFNAQSNDLQKSGALIRLGKRVLFDEEKFFQWVDGQQE